MTIGRPRLRWLGCVIVGTAISGPAALDLRAGADDVIPLPRHIERLDGTLTLDGTSPLRVELADDGDSSYAIGVKQLADDLRSLGVSCQRGAVGAGPNLFAGRPTADAAFAERCRKAGALPDPKWGPEGYRLKITPRSILIAGNGQAGCFYGLQTLRQMLDPIPGDKAVKGGGTDNGAALECVDVSDWPAMKWRGTMYGLASPAEHARLAYYKLNLFNWEVNQNPDYQTIGELAGGTPLSRYREVAASARRHFVNMTLETQSFGHVSWMLGKFPKLRALPDNTHVLRPLHEPTYELIGRIYAELCPLYDTPIYHAGCDEAWGIEAWAKKQGLNCAEVVGRHLQRLADVLDKHGKRTMIWGDYLLKHPDAIQWMKPKDFLICDWHYSPSKAYRSVEFFVGKGFETLVSPAVMPARPIFPDYARQIPNIRGFIQDGVRRGAVGLLNTNWPVNPMPTECYWYGWICGAEYAWNPTGRTQAQFDRVFFRKAYGLSAGQGLDLFKTLSRLAGFHGLDQRARRAPKTMLRETVQAARQIVVPVHHRAKATPLREAQVALDKAVQAVRPIDAQRLKTFQQILDRLRLLSDYLENAQALGMAIAEALTPARGGGPERAAERFNDVRRRSTHWIEVIRAAPHLNNRTEALGLAADILKAAETPGQSVEGRRQALMGLLGLKPEPLAKTVRLKPGLFFRFESDPTKTVAPSVRQGGWCHFERRDAAASWTFKLRRPGRYRILALLRHSAGIWQGNRFVKGGRNAAYVGRYGWKLDGKPIKARWIGDELNPEADEAFQWAVLADKHLDPGAHTLYAHVTGMNHAIVAEFVFTQDPNLKPETRRTDIKMK